MVSGRVVATITVFVRVRHDRIANVPQMPLAFVVHGFQIADRGAALRAPVDDVPAAIDQAFFVEAHKHFGDRAGKLG